jgi:hypothetical protein
MICLFSVFEVIEPQGNYIEELYARVSTNSHGCFVVTFPTLHVFYIDVKHTYFTTLMKYILELRVTLICENVSINKIIMRLVKLCM